MTPAISACCCRIEFDDLHQAGLYTWDYLYGLGVHKLSHARAYIRQLRERGLSREPGLRPTANKFGVPGAKSTAPGVTGDGSRKKGVMDVISDVKVHVHGSCHEHGDGCSEHHHQH